LISFPALLAAGYSAFSANIANTLSLIPGYVGNTIGYRRELAGQAKRVWIFGAATVIGSAGGTAAFLMAPSADFRKVVPYLILLAAILMAVQKRVASLVAKHRSARSARSVRSVRSVRSARSDRPAAVKEHTVPLLLVMTACGAYAGYFGAGVSVILLATLGAMVADSLQRLNALRSVLTFTGNLLAGVVFIFVTHVAWLAVAIMAPTSLAGGWLGSSVARKIPDNFLRWSVVVFAGVVGLVLLVQ
ncbi:MAG TPA: sulfite exporter TauE/SafE family protein, partial [Acidimicrobiales bacterium]|nr:sulfite exporter TauE/SafE family protein [Acidimicrobiales bacterium]